MALTINDLAKILSESKDKEDIINRLANSLESFIGNQDKKDKWIKLCNGNDKVNSYIDFINK